MKILKKKKLYILIQWTIPINSKKKKKKKKNKKKKKKKKKNNNYNK